MRLSRKAMLGIIGLGIEFSQQQVDTNDLKKGLRLEPIEFPEDHKEYGRDYSYLYKDGNKVSDMIFRRGGIGGRFKGDYCQLIAYPDFPEKTLGNHCIINKEGEVVLMESNHFDHLYLLRGCIAKMKEDYYNLKTGELIARGSSSVESDEYLFVQHRLDYNKENPMQTGVYKINYASGEVELFKSK